MTVSPEIVAKHESFIQKYFSVVDSMDLENFKNLFLVDGTFTLGNYPAAVGHSQVGHAANGIFTVLSQIRHQVVKIYSVKEGELTYHHHISIHMITPIPMTYRCDYYGRKGLLYP